MINTNLTVFVVDSDVYARHSITGYLAWDRRTRVTRQISTLAGLEDRLRQTPKAELPDSILLDDLLIPTPDDAAQALKMIQRYCKAHVLVLAHRPHAEIARAIKAAGGNGYLLREEVNIRVSWLVVWAHDLPFVVTHGTKGLVSGGNVLPEPREYPELTDRIRQALMLCVVEGMSAELAADEMGLSPHTIRTYIKEGYSILESHDQTEYPAKLSPQEKAFMRFTALELDNLTDKIEGE